RSVVVAAAILVDVVPNVRVHDLSGEFRTGRLEADVHQAAVRNALDAEASEKCAQFSGALLVGEAARSNSFGRGIGILKLRLTGENTGADGLQGERFTGQDLGLGLDVVFEVQHIVVR